jgi:hypothetical protein
MQYQVPQFIEVEDRLFGPLTFKQFVYIAGGAAIGFILWSFLPKFLAVIIGAPIVGFFITAAFYKVNGRPFLFFVENFFKYNISPKLYIWKKEHKKPKKGKRAEAKEAKINIPAVPKLSESKLREVSWGLDVHENLAEPNSPQIPNPNI